MPLELMARDIPFGEREGAIDAPNLSKSEISRDLRIAIWNECVPWLFSNHSSSDDLFRARMFRLCRGLSWPADEAALNRRTMQNRLKGWLLDETLSSWTRFYPFVELIPQLAITTRSGEQLPVLVTKRLNSALEQHGSQYRLTNGKLAPITNEEELKEISEAAASQDRFMPPESTLRRQLRIFQKSPNRHIAIV